MTMSCDGVVVFLCAVLRRALFQTCLRYLLVKLNDVLVIPADFTPWMQAKQLSVYVFLKLMQRAPLHGLSGSKPQR